MPGLGIQDGMLKAKLKDIVCMTKNSKKYSSQIWTLIDRSKIGLNLVPSRFILPTVWVFLTPPELWMYKQTFCSDFDQ